MTGLFVNSHLFTYITLTTHCTVAFSLVAGLNVNFSKSNSCFENPGLGWMQLLYSKIRRQKTQKRHFGACAPFFLFFAKHTCDFTNPFACSKLKPRSRIIYAIATEDDLLIPIAQCTSTFEFEALASSVIG